MVVVCAGLCGGAKFMPRYRSAQSSTSAGVQIFPSGGNDMCESQAPVVVHPGLYGGAKFMPHDSSVRSLTDALFQSFPTGRNRGVFRGLVHIICVSPVPRIAVCMRVRAEVCVVSAAMVVCTELYRGAQWVLGDSSVRSSTAALQGIDSSK